MIYFTSDLHFGHDRDFIYKARGFDSYQEHDQAVIARWNRLIQDDDDVYVLGDVMLRDLEYGLTCVKQLKGRIHLIRGNHDSDTRWAALAEIPNIIEQLGYASMMTYDRQPFYLSHYPAMTANFSDDVHLRTRVLCLCGHTHSKEKFYMGNPYIYNVALDAHDCVPIALEKILHEIRSAHYRLLEEAGE